MIKKVISFFLILSIFASVESLCLFNSNEIENNAFQKANSDSDILLLTSLYVASFILLVFPSFYIAERLQAVNDYGVYAIVAGSFIILTSPWLLFRTPSKHESSLILSDKDRITYEKHYKSFVYFNRIVSLLIPVSVIIAYGLIVM
ncbi:MAG: hypothetical protein AB7T10_09150 [bacterium]